MQSGDAMEAEGRIQELSDEKAMAMLRVVRTSTMADVLEEHGFHGAMDPRIRAVVAPEHKLVGRAITMKKTLFREDASEARLSSSHHLFEILEVARPGDVLVIAAEGATHAASYGDLAGRAARARGMAGVVVDGAVRDVAELRTIGLPVFAAGIHMSSGLKRLLSLGMNVPVICGRVEVRPGDYIIGDGDGVVVVPRRLNRAILDAFKAEQAELDEAVFIEETGSFLEAFRRFGRA